MLSVVQGSASSQTGRAEALSFPVWVAAVVFSSSSPGRSLEKKGKRESISSERFTLLSCCWFMQPLGPQESTVLEFPSSQFTAS